MAEPAILRREEDGVLELVLNRPEKLNALNQEILDGLAQAVSDLRLCDEHRVMLIRARGRYFSAGADLTSFPNPFTDSALKSRSWFRREMGGMQTLWQEMELVEKPIVVAHHAMCVGGGLEMSLSCDFRLAAKSAGYWFPEAKLGMVPASGGVSRLTRICGAHWAKWMVLANQPVTAERALTMGLVHEIYPDETFEEDVRAFCQQLASFPAETMAIAKTAVELAADLESAQARQVERLAFSNLLLGREYADIHDQHVRSIVGAKAEASG